MNSLEKQIEKALHLQQQGQVEQAIEIFKTILKADPNQVDALHGLGMAFAQQHHYPQAVGYLLKAVQLAPHIAPFHNNLANAYKAIGKTNEAIAHYQEALRLKSNYPQVHNNLGALLFRLGKFEEAATHFQKALRMDSESVDTHYNLANTFVQLDQLSIAQTHYEKVLQLRPDHLGALHNLGLTLTTLKNFSEALPYLEASIAREPENKNILFHLGVVYAALNETDQAKTYYARLLALYPDDAKTHHNLATIYLQAHDQKNALKHYQAALQFDPQNETAKHMVAALEGHTTASAPLGYTRALFDQYAYSYDTHVKETLHYQVPSLLRQAITPFIKGQTEPFNALDLGCGTGLCAPLFSDITIRLTGVDLSPNMIEVARAQGGYYKLHCDDVVHFLQNQKERYDLIIAADLFVYFGDLKIIFGLIHDRLQVKGLFTFNIEKNEVNSDFQLKTTGRYGHASAYIHALCRDQFEILSETTATLRYQEEKEVAGHIFVIRRS